MQKADVICGLYATSVDLVVQDEQSVDHRSDVEEQIVVQIARDAEQAFAIRRGGNVVLDKDFKVKVGFGAVFKGLQLVRVDESFRQGQADTGDTMTLGMWLDMQQSVHGRKVEAVGENAEAAAFSGVPVEWTVVLAHVLAGLIAAVAALVQTGSIAVGSVRVGLDLPILAVAATILGGVVFGRGEGGVWGPFFGVLSFALLFVVMTVFGIGDCGKLIAQGLIILLAAIL